MVYFYSENLTISSKRYLVSIFTGVPQLAFGFIFITIGSRTTPAVMVGIINANESYIRPNMGLAIL